MTLDPMLFPPVAPLSPLVPPQGEARKMPRRPDGGPNVPNFSGPAVPMQTPVGLSQGIQQAPVFDMHRYASIQDNNFAVGTAAASRVVEKPATRRNFLALRNTSLAANIFVGFGRQASLVSTFILAPGQTLLFDTVVPQDDVWLIADAASASCSVAYSNLPGLG